jgi:hypothetical protein
MKAPVIAVLAAAAVCAGCAHIPSGEPVAASFPENFALTQVIHVKQGGNEMDFLASLRRRGSDYELAMLDPTVQVPLYIAHTEGGRLVETKPLPPEARGLGALLIQSLAELFGAQTFVRRPAAMGEGDVFVFRTRRLEFEATPWAMTSKCPFPAEIRMKTRGGPDMTAVARTEDVACGE